MIGFRHILSIVFAAYVLVGASFSNAALADTGSEQTVAPIYTDRANELLEILQGSEREEEFFAPSFRAAVPEPQFRALLAQLKEQYGQPQSIHRIVSAGSTDGTVEVLFEKALVAMRLVIDRDPPHPVIGLLVTGTSMRRDGLSQIADEIIALPGASAFAIAEISGPNPEPISSHQSTKQMAIGSTAKLYVLAELARAIEQGERNWDDVIPLSQKSLPSGMLQNWPEGAPLTLQTLATLMISISDNSATDILITELGRTNIGEMLIQTGHGDSDGALPFLTTVEAFALKMPTRSALRARYLAASERDQATILSAEQSQLGLASASVSNLATTPRHIDTIEWFAAPDDTNRLLHRLSRSRDPIIREIMKINTIIPPGDAQRWTYLGGKGGSEPGVISFAFLASAASGRTYAVSGSWNDADKPVDNDKFLSLMNRLLNIMSTR